MQHQKRENKIRVLLRGGGDLASGAALRLIRAGYQVVITEIEKPLAVRRSVAFAQAVFEKKVTIEGITCARAENAEDVFNILEQGIVPVIVDPSAEIRFVFHPHIIVDARMMKQSPEFGIREAELIVGLGPGFTAGKDCHAVIETKRGFFMGRVYWQGTAEPNSGTPESVMNHEESRVLRAPVGGIFHTNHEIGNWVEEGDVIASVNGQEVKAKFSGLIRGLLHDEIEVQKNLKIGDIDPRNDERLIKFRI